MQVMPIQASVGDYGGVVLALQEHIMGQKQLGKIIIIPCTRGRHMHVHVRTYMQETVQSCMHSSSAVSHH
jgi:hypothetical protein